MRFYFAGSVRGAGRDTGSASVILDTLQSRGEVVNPHIAGADPEAHEIGLSDARIFARDVAWLRSSDMVVAEVSHASHGVGYEIALAEQLGKRVVCLRSRDAPRTSAMVTGNPSVEVYEYADLSEIPAVLEKALSAKAPPAPSSPPSTVGQSRRPLKLATLVYARHQGKTLMVHRIKRKGDMHEGKWNGLGGKFEAGETPEECAARELYEECGLQAKKLELKGLLTFPAFSKGEDWYVFAFVVPEFSGELRQCDEGELKWIPDAELMSLNLWEGDRFFLPWLDRPGFFSARFVYEDGKLTGHEEKFYG